MDKYAFCTENIRFSAALCIISHKNSEVGYMEELNTQVPAGTLKVSTDVIISIAEAAAAETEGVAVNSSNGLLVMKDGPFSAKVISPIKVRLGSDTASIDISIITEAGSKAYEVAKNVQEHVKSSVQNMTGITVSKVNVRIVASVTK